MLFQQRWDESGQLSALKGKGKANILALPTHKSGKRSLVFLSEVVQADRQGLGAMRIYLDHNATAPMHPAASEVWRTLLADPAPRNPSSVHQPGQDARRILEDARRGLAAGIAARAGELVFTSSGSEANALALRGTLPARGERRRILASAVEHPSVLDTLKAMAAERPEIAVELLPVDRDGRVDLQRADELLAPDVLLVSCMLANNETGVVQPVRELALLARNHGALVHCDAVQAVGKLRVDVADLGVDLLTAGAHKFGGGHGCGILYVRRGTTLTAQVGGHQEQGRRGGTPNVPAIAAAAAALAAQLPELEATATRVSALRARFEHGVLAAVPDTAINGLGAPRLSNTSNFTFSGADGEALLIALDLEGIAASSGAACASGTLEPSHVLLAQGLSRADAKASVRFSLGVSSTDADIDRVLERLPGLVERVRRAGASQR